MKLNDEQKELLSLLQFKEDELKGKKLTDSQKLIYACLCFCNDGYTDFKGVTNGWFTQSYGQIRKKTHLASDETISTGINVLVNFGLIKYKQGTTNGRIANQFFICSNEKCSEKSVVIDFEKCSNEERINFLKDRKLNKSVVKKCSDTEKKCSIDIDIEKDIEKEQYIEQLIKENNLLKEELDKVKKELEEVKREKGLKTDNMMNVKSNMPLTGEVLPFKDEEVKKDVSWFDNLISSNEESNKMMEGKEIVNCPSNEGSNNSAMPEEKSSLISSNEDWKSRKAAQDELKKEFDKFIGNLKNLTVQEGKENLETFKLKAASVFTGKYVGIYIDNFQKRFDGYTAKMEKNNPSKAKARKEAQPCNNEGMGVAAASASKEQPKKKINLQTCGFDEFTAYIRFLAAKIGVDEIEVVTENLHNAIKNNIALKEYDRQVLKYDWQQKMNKLKETATQKNNQAEPTIKDKNTDLSNDSIYNKFKYELQHIETAENAKDWVFNNKNTIQKLEPKQRDELKKLYIEILNAA